MKAYQIIRILFIIVFIGCNDNPAWHLEEEKGGICLTFDDTYVDEWYKISDLFLENNIKATFFLTKAYSLSSNEIEELQTLDSLGFEIGCHGYDHIDALAYLESHTLEDYYETEVAPALNYMHNINLYPESYSYPYGNNDDSLDTFLLNYFNILRDVAEAQRNPLTTDVDEIDEIYCRKGDTTVVAALGIDVAFDVSGSQLKKAVERASSNKEILVLYAHCPVDSNAQSYQTNKEYLQYLISLVQEYDLNTYMISELAE